MSAMDYDNPRPRSIPDWLIDDTASPVGARLRSEWIDKIQASAGADRGETRLAAAMLQLQSQRPRRPLLPQANARALRWVDARLRASRAARTLASVNPTLPWPARLYTRLAGLATPALAAMLLLLCRTGVLSALEGITRVGSRLARLHIDRHIGPFA